MVAVAIWFLIKYIDQNESSRGGGFKVNEQTH